MEMKPILLVVGVHADEVCAPIVAAKVREMLLDVGGDVEVFDVPRRLTLLGYLDAPDDGATEYCFPAGGSVCDVNLWGLVGDEALSQAWPDRIPFEFHNSPWDFEKFGIGPDQDVRTFEVGPIAPTFTRPYQIGTWRNSPASGVPGKYVVEIPACYQRVSADVEERRRRILARLENEGWVLPSGHDFYLTREANVELSKERGFLDDCIAAKIVDWIIRTVS